MRSRSGVGIIAAAGLVAVAACSKTTEPSLLSDSQISSDVASTSGDAVARDVQNLIGNESGGAFPGAPAGSAAAADSLNVSRTVTCYDSTGAVQASCNATTTDSVTVHWTVNGSFTDTASTGNIFSASVHRTHDGTITNLLGTETFRVHNAVGTGNDTTMFTGSRGSREKDESATDSIVNIRFDLPRSSHPLPTSGEIIRNVSGTVKLTGANASDTRTFNRRVTVTFPADAQGNVVLTVNGMTCNLNLYTRRVTACS